jgi:hypothetical protein
MTTLSISADIELLNSNKTDQNKNKEMFLVAEILYRGIHCNFASRIFLHLLFFLRPTFMMSGVLYFEFDKTE